MGFQQYIAVTILEPCILSMWPNQLSLCARMKFIMFLCFIISSSYRLVLMRHIPFSLFGPNIFLKIFLSNTNSLLIMVSFKIHVSHEYVTIGLITELYIFNFDLFDKCLLWNIFLFVKQTLFPKSNNYYTQVLWWLFVHTYILPTNFNVFNNPFTFLCMCYLC
jgi:hypothetical protein